MSPGTLVRARAREWVVQPSDDPDLLLLKPLGGTEDEIAGIYKPLGFPEDAVEPAIFQPPAPVDIGDFATARLLFESDRLAFRNGSGPFRCLAKLSFRPRAYQIVPLVMALRQETVRLLIADDVGVGKTIEALLIIREMLERRRIRRFAVVCLPHLCDQWQGEIQSKLGLDAVVIRSNTQARLDREIQGDVSVFQYYPYQILSIDYIKQEGRRQIFLGECPELLIVDEAHTCARPAGAHAAQQQRYHLISQLAADPARHAIFLTATPHSGKPDEFQSLLGLLHPGFETLDIPSAGQEARRHLARHFIQRKRADVEKWIGRDSTETTPFPVREPLEWDYTLSARYNALFERILDFCQSLVRGEDGDHRQRVRYWTALGLLRGVMSSPSAGARMLRNRMSKLDLDDSADDRLAHDPEDNPVHDSDHGFDTDAPPTAVVARTDWTDHQKRRLSEFATEIESLANPKDDLKLAAAEYLIDDLLKDGYCPVVFCRYIPTARYVGELLGPRLSAKHRDLDLQVVTSEDPDDVRRQRIEGMGGSARRVLIATDCLSEGINLQEHFTAVLHYDLPWNPNRLEQREGRVDRFGQTAETVKAYLLFGGDNPIDGIVLDVLLRKVREIKKATGINVPFPEDSKSIIDTIAQALLVNPDRRITARRRDNQTVFDFAQFPEAEAVKIQSTNELEKAAEREKASRSIFAQHAIKAQEIEQDLREMDEALGDPRAVERFVTQALSGIFGAQCDPSKHGFRLHPGNLPAGLKETLGANGQPLLLSFASPTPRGHLYLGRNHPFVEQLCQLVMARSLDRAPKRAARAAVIRCAEVTTKTTLLLFRARNLIEQKAENHQIVAEEMVLWGFRGSPRDNHTLTHDEARALLFAARPAAVLTPEARVHFLEDELRLLPALQPAMDALAKARCEHLVEAHERFSKLVSKSRYQVVFPVLPMDVLGIYVLLPNNPS
ncbi:MAG: DEAD/DEAH box helicase [Opitutales bacterium]|nr:DEAD/DEAH box helicase [Opitutales bacterium]